MQSIRETLGEKLWRDVRLGIFVGGIIFYAAIIGMIETFHERDLVDGVFSMGQVLLVLPALIGAYWINRKEENIAYILRSGLVIGVLAAILPIVLVVAADTWNLRGIFVNITKPMIGILTFEQDSLLWGNLILLGVTTLSGFIGAVVTIIPERPRRVLLYTAGGALLVSMLSELVSQIVGEFFERDALRPYFRRGTLKLPGISWAIAIIAGWSIFWELLGEKIRTNYAQMTTIRKSKTNEGVSSEVLLRRGLAFLPHLVLLIGLIILPQVTGSFLSQVLFTVGLYVLMGLGLNIAVGQAGLLDLGYVTNFAVGAYIAAFLTSTGPLGLEARTGIHFNLWMVLPIALLSAMMTGFIFALPVLKMRGDYLAIATLGFGEIIGRLAVSDWFKPVIGGAQGLKQIPPPVFFGIELSQPQHFYYILLVIIIFMVIISTRLNNSRIGRQWMAIREDEDAAAAMGINVALAKLLAFTISAAIGGVSGAVFSSRVLAVFPNSFTLLVSLNVLSLIIVGGVGSISGIILGAVFLIGVPEILREFNEYRFLLYGILLIVMMLARPQGIIPSQTARREQNGDEHNDPQFATE